MMSYHMTLLFCYKSFTHSLGTATTEWGRE